MQAVAQNRLDEARAWLNAGADIQAQTPGGATALMAATLNGHVEAVRWLLANGANPNATNKKKVTALAIAKARKHPDIVAALEKAGARR